MKEVSPGPEKEPRQEKLLLPEKPGWGVTLPKQPKLLPTKQLRPQERVFNTDYADNLERTDPLLSFPQQVLHWKSGDLAPLSGFDMRIKVPVNLEYKKMEIEQQILIHDQMDKVNTLFF